MKYTHNNGLLRNQRGTSVMEFALVLPVLLAFVFGLVEMGYMYFASSTVEKAAQIGARYAVTGNGHDEGTRNGDIVSAVRDFTATLETKGTVDITLRNWPTKTPTGEGQVGSAGTPCDMMEVEVQYRYAPLTPIIGDLLPNPITLEGSERMLNEPWLPCD